MRKVKTYDFGEFMRDEHAVKFNPNDYTLFSVGTASTIAMSPSLAFASSNTAFTNMWSAVIGIVDWIAAGVFLFAGVTWMFGRQTKGIELIICGTTGYLLARHAIDIRDFLKTI